MFRLGVIGIRGQAGLWARGASSQPGWQLSFCYHPDRNRHDAQLPLRQTDSFQQLLKSSEAIVIASPTFTHIGYLKRLAEASYPGIVLVEKPVVATLLECTQLLDHFPRSFLNRVYVAQNWRFYPWVRKMRRLIEPSVQQKKVISADFQLTHDFGYKPGYRRSWRSERKTHPIGPAETQGIHLVDLIHYFFGPVDWIVGQVTNIARAGSAPDTASLFLMTKSGVACSIHTSYAAPVAYAVQVVTSQRILSYRNGTLQEQHRSMPRSNQRSQPSSGKTLLTVKLDGLLAVPIRQQLAALRRCLEGGSGSSLVPLFQGIANAAVLAGWAEDPSPNRLLRLSENRIYQRTVRSFRSRA